MIWVPTVCQVPRNILITLKRKIWFMPSLSGLENKTGKVVFTVHCDKCYPVWEEWLRDTSTHNLKSHSDHPQISGFNFIFPSPIPVFWLTYITTVFLVRIHVFWKYAQKYLSLKSIIIFIWISILWPWNTGRRRHPWISAFPVPTQD